MTLERFIKDLDSVRRTLNAVSGPQVHSDGLRKSLRAVVTAYFSEIRPSLLRDDEGSPQVLEVDRRMQDLLELSHKHGSTKRYRDLLAGARKFLVALDGALVARVVPAKGPAKRDEIDARIIETLSRMLPGAAASYEQALHDLGSSARLSWRGPATDLREALRETLDHLAPDEEVKAMPGYKAAPDAKGPTMKQKVRFILRNRGSSSTSAETSESATEAVDEILGGFVRSVYSRSSVSAHTPTDRAEVVRVRDLVRVVLCELLEVRL